MSAASLRLSFTLLLSFALGYPLLSLYHTARQYGYFYSLAERQALWKLFPDSKALAALISIYGQDSSLPEIRLIRALDDPSHLNIGDLQESPQWAEPFRLVVSANFDARLRQLQSDRHFNGFEALLKASENGRLLNESQRRQLDSYRHEELCWFVEQARPKSTGEMQAYRYRMQVYFHQPWELEGSLRTELLRKTRQNQMELVANRLAPWNIELNDLRRLLVQTALNGLAPEVQGALKKAAEPYRHYGSVYIGDQQLLLLAHLKKLLPSLDLNDLATELTPKKLSILSSLQDLSSNSSEPDRPPLPAYFQIPNHGAFMRRRERLRTNENP